MEPARLENWMDIRMIVIMCVGTDKGSWWADKEFGSNLWQLRQIGKTVETLSVDVKREIEDCLSWLVTDGLALRVICSTAITGKTAIEWMVTVERPESGTEQIIKDVWNAV